MQTQSTTGRTAVRGLCALLAGLCLGFAAAAPAQMTATSAAAVKVAFIYNFGKFVDWPQGTFDNASSFTICTEGDVDEFHPAFAELGGRQLRSLPVEVRAAGPGLDLKGCNTLLVARSERDRLRPILKAAAEQHVLTVSDMDDFAEAGGDIALITRNGRVQFNVNAAAARSAGLSPSAELLGLAHAVIGQGGG